MTIFNQIVTFIILLPTAIFFFLNTASRNMYLFLGANLILGILSEIFSYYFTKSYKTNLPIHNIYFLFNFITIYLFLTISNNEFIRRKKITFGILIFIIVLWFVEVFVLSDIFKTAFLFRILTSIILLIHAITFLSKEMEKDSTVRIPNIIIGIAMVLYNAFLVFLYLMTSPVFNLSKEIIISSWNIAKINNLVYYVLLAIAFLWTRKK